MGCTITKRRRLRVIAQCKAEKRKMGPGYLRELEGVVYRHTAAVSGMSSPHPASEPEPEPESSSPRIPQALSTTTGDHPTRTTTSITTTATARRAHEHAPAPPPVALLVSESAFTRNCLLAAHASPLPFLLVHLPSQSSSSGSGAVGTVFGNPALVSAKGVLGGELEIRWERGGGVPLSSPSGVLGGGRPRLWWQGQPLPSWTPDADHGVVLNHR
jgi:hypothetical protein